MEERSDQNYTFEYIEILAKNNRKRSVRHELRRQRKYRFLFDDTDYANFFLLSFFLLMKFSFKQFFSLSFALILLNSFFVIDFIFFVNGERLKKKIPHEI